MSHYTATASLHELFTEVRPNFENRANRKRADQVLSLAYKLMFLPHGRRRIPATELYKITGRPNRHHGAYFLSMFHQLGKYTKGGQSYEYAPNPERVEQLEKRCNLKHSFSEYAAAHGKSFSEPPSLRGGPDYTRTGDRYYAWWVWMRGEFRTKLFLETHGTGFDYDIQAAKPTMILQMYRKWMQKHRPMHLRLFEKCALPTWSALVADRTQFRQALAAEAGITLAQAKDVCQAVLNSGFASPNEENGICQLIGSDAALRVMQSPRYRGLQDDFRMMWSYLKSSAQPGETDGEYMSRQYEALELKVMDVVERELKAPAWFVHDGFLSVQEVDMCALEQAVFLATGLTIQFEETRLTGKFPEEEQEREVISLSSLTGISSVPARPGKPARPEEEEEEEEREVVVPGAAGGTSPHLMIAPFSEREEEEREPAPPHVPRLLKLHFTLGGKCNFSEHLLTC